MLNDSSVRALANPQAPSLRLVRVGTLVLSEDRIARTADESVLQELFGVRRPLESVVGQPLEQLFQPLGEEDGHALRGPLPFSYLAVVRDTAARCLVRVSRLPAETGPGLVASVVAVNEYLAESESLARVQLRNTVESIIAGFAHEVRNPLAAILSLTEAALQQDPSPDTALVRIPSLVARVESLIKQSLAYSRPKPPNRALHHPTFLLEHAVALLRPRGTHVRLRFEEAENVPPVMVDLTQGEQILVNLLENALDAASSEVRVRIRPGKTSAPSVCIEVNDDGPGVPQEVASRIFNPFFTTKAHGTGLGLAIARDLTRLNGGELQQVPSSAGARFWVYLPSTADRVLSF